jgi:hypothetical protein
MFFEGFILQTVGCGEVATVRRSFCCTGTRARTSRGIGSPVARALPTQPPTERERRALIREVQETFLRDA